MGLRLKLVLAFAAVASLLLGVGVSSFFINRQIQTQVADLRARHDVDLQRLDLEDSSLEIEGFWDPSGAFVATDIDAAPGRRRPKLRGPLQAVDARAGKVTLFGVEVQVTPDTDFAGPARDLDALGAGDRVELKAVVEDGRWRARMIRTGDIKHNDKLKVTPTSVEIDGVSPETLEIHGLTVSLAPYNADSPESALQRIQLATGMALAAQECRAAAQEWVGRNLSSRPLRSLSDLDADELVPVSAAERLTLCARDFAHYLDQSSFTERTLGSPGIFARRLNDLRELHGRFEDRLAAFRALANTNPRDAQRLLDTQLDPYLSDALMPAVFAYREEAEEALEDQVRAISTSVDRTTRVALASSLAAVLLAVVLGVLIWRSIHVPIRDLVHAVRRLGEGKLDTRVEVRSRDELGLLASAFNQMALEIASTTVSVSNLENIFDSMAGGLIICDRDGRVTSVNGATEKLLGYESRELVGRPFESLYVSSDKDLVPLSPQRDHAATRSGEVTFLRKDASELPAALTVSELLSDAGVAQGYVCVAQDLTERKRIEETLRDSLSEKEVLLGEIHHRVKNNLQVVSSLLEMQSSGSDDPQTIAHFAESQSRIRSMALIHEQLCETSLSSSVDLREYLERLIDQLMHNHNGEGLAFEIDLDPITSGIDAALTCGLITNELVSNSLKHAFPKGRAGRIRVSLHEDASGTRILEVADDGCGLGREFEDCHSLGLSLVRTLTRQLRGELQVDSDGGTRIRVVYPGEREEAAA